MSNKVIDDSTVAACGSQKIKPRHLDRLAIVYVRQSSPQQVRENRESRERQYSLREHAGHLGWPQAWAGRKNVCWSLMKTRVSVENAAAIAPAFSDCWQK